MSRRAHRAAALTDHAAYLSRLADDAQAREHTARLARPVYAASDALRMAADLAAREAEAETSWPSPGEALVARAWLRIGRWQERASVAARFALVALAPLFGVAVGVALVKGLAP